MHMLFELLAFLMNSEAYVHIHILVTDQACKLRCGLSLHE